MAKFTATIGQKCEHSCTCTLDPTSNSEERPKKINYFSVHALGPLFSLHPSKLFCIFSVFNFLTFTRGATYLNKPETLK
jgi:hypothetical protein